METSPDPEPEQDDENGDRRPTLGAPGTKKEASVMPEARKPVAMTASTGGLRQPAAEHHVDEAAGHLGRAESVETRTPARAEARARGQERHLYVAVRTADRTEARPSGAKPHIINRGKRPSGGVSDRLAVSSEAGIFSIGVLRQGNGTCGDASARSGPAGR